MVQKSQLCKNVYWEVLLSSIPVSCQPHRKPFWVIFPTFLFVKIVKFSYIFNTLFRQKLAYYIICPAPCFFNLMYPGDHSTSVHRDLSLSCLFNGCIVSTVFGWITIFSTSSLLVDTWLFPPIICYFKCCSIEPSVILILWKCVLDSY